VYIISKLRCTQGTKSSVKLNHTWLMSHICSYFAHDRTNCSIFRLLFLVFVVTPIKKTFLLAHRIHTVISFNHSYIVELLTPAYSLGYAWAVLLPRLGAVSAVSRCFKQRTLHICCTGHGHSTHRGRSFHLRRYRTCIATPDIKIKIMAVDTSN